MVIMNNRKTLTLCLVHQHPRILLGMKKRGFGAGRWNGFGGKVLENEPIEAAARRELLEECGIEAGHLEKYGVLEFDFQATSGPGLEVHVYKIEDFRGEPRETEEMRPQWFSVEEIPFREMWPSDLYWFPLLIKGRKFRRRFLFDRPSTPEYQSKIIEKSIETCYK